MRTSRLEGKVSWADETPVTGFALVALVPPKNIYGNVWASLFSGRVEIPIWTKIQIKEGQFDDQIELFYNSDISPPNTKYVIYYYDGGGGLLGSPNGAEDAFIVNSEKTTPPIYINEASEAGTEIPKPEGVV